MKLAVLFSGGKDSCLALYKAMQEQEVVCLISLFSKNKESYMFHTPNISITMLQAEAIGLPLLKQETAGEKETELKDLRKVIQEAKEMFGIEGVVTGAIESVYQAIRVQRICNDLNLWCFNPLWQKDQVELMQELLQEDFRIIISGVFAYPFDESYLGKEIDKKLLNRLLKLRQDFGISPSGEGGEIETTVIDAPFFKKKIIVTKSSKSFKNYSGVYNIEEAKVAEK